MATLGLLLTYLMLKPTENLTLKGGIPLHKAIPFLKFALYLTKGFINVFNRKANGFLRQTKRFEFNLS